MTVSREEVKKESKRVNALIGKYLRSKGFPPTWIELMPYDDYRLCSAYLNWCGVAILDPPRTRLYALCLLYASHQAENFKYNCYDIVD